MTAKPNGTNTSLLRSYIRVFAAVSIYWTFSISLVFLNKHLLSGNKKKNFDAPLFVTWYQCVCTVALCYLCSKLAMLFPNHVSFPDCSFDKKISREVLPLSFVFVGMITFNNLCLKHVGVAFYNVGRSLTTVFNVICVYIILGQRTSVSAITCCAIIIAGFFLGVNQEDAAGTLSVWGVLFGVSASLFVALNAIYTKKVLPAVGDSIWKLTLYNNINACVLFVPLMLLNGDLISLTSFEDIFDGTFWLLMSLSGVFGFMMGYVTGFQIQVTSPLTHNISGTAKAAAQTVMAVWWFSDIKTVLWWISNATVLFGSGAYTFVKQQEMQQAHKATQLTLVSALSEDPASEALLMRSDNKISDDDDEAGNRV